MLRSLNGKKVEWYFNFPTTKADSIAIKYNYYYAVQPAILWLRKTYWRIVRFTKFLRLLILRNDTSSYRQKIIPDVRYCVWFIMARKLLAEVINRLSECCKKIPKILRFEIVIIILRLSHYKCKFFYKDFSTCIATGT